MNFSQMYVKREHTTELLSIVLIVITKVIVFIQGLTN